MMQLWEQCLDPHYSPIRSLSLPQSTDSTLTHSESLFCVLLAFPFTTLLVSSYICPSSEFNSTVITVTLFTTTSLTWLNGGPHLSLSLRTTKGETPSGPTFKLVINIPSKNLLKLANLVRNAKEGQQKFNDRSVCCFDSLQVPSFS
jgi:hypothetical protein